MSRTFRGVALLSAGSLWGALALAGCDGGERSPASGAKVSLPLQESGPLPPNRFLDEWIRDSKTELYTGAELYGLIDGGAEVFLELGFDRVEVQRYRRGTDEVSVEIYSMTDPLAALGIFLMKCGREDRDASFAERHTRNPYQVLFCKGSCYVTVGNAQGTAGATAALLPFAQHVAAHLPAPELGSSDAGDPFALLPAEHRAKGSERIIRGPFTLQEVCSLGAGDVLLLAGKVTAFAADYDSAGDGRHTRLVAAYPDEGAARAAFEYLRSHLDPRLEVTSSSAARFVFKDYKEEYGLAKVRKSRIDLQVNLASEPGG
ncbi:MAG: DUF6599 family protein [Planctomycetota bacterium]